MPASAGLTNGAKDGRKRPTMASEPIHDIAHLGHVELLTPKFEESRKFFIDVMGMTQSGEKGDSVYLRGWDDYERYSLKLTASKGSGLGHAAFRTRSPQALERRAAALKGSGFDIGWTDGDLGHGKTFAFRDPDGHNFEIYYETEWYEPPPDLKPALKNQAQKFPARGINARRIDHFNGLAVDIKANREFFRSEWYEPPPDLKPALKNQAQKFPARGINARRIDHFNGLAVDIKANREFF